MANYELIVAGSPIPIRRPTFASWDQPLLGQRGNGAPRISAVAKVTWNFPKLRESELMTLVGQFPSAGTVTTFRTLVPPVGGTPRRWVLCTGQMQPIDMGVEYGGFYFGVSVSFNRVREV